MSTPLEASRELDAKVAEKVMGWAWKRAPMREVSVKALVPPDDFTSWKELRGDEVVAQDYARFTPHYSTDTAAAWLVVKKVQREHPGWRFCLLGGDAQYGYTRRRDSTFVVDKSRNYVFGWEAEFFGDEDPTQCTGQRHASEWGETPELAICRAALKASENSNASVSLPSSSEEEQ